MKKFAARVARGGIYDGQGRELPIGTELKVSEEQAKMLGPKIELGPEVQDDEADRVEVTNDDQKDPETKGEGADKKAQDESKGEGLKLPETKASK